jgi:hypothetical protein
MFRNREPRSRDEFETERRALITALEKIETQLLLKGEASVIDEAVGFAPATGNDYDFVRGRVEVDEIEPNANARNGRYPHIVYDVLINNDKAIEKNQGLVASLDRDLGYVDNRRRTLSYFVYDTGQAFRRIADVNAFQVEHVAEETTSLEIKDLNELTRQLSQVVDVFPPSS